MSLELIDFNTGLPVLVKQPNESRMYRIDFSNLLVGASLSSITSVISVKQDVVGGSTNVDISSQALDGDSVQFRIANGTAEENYKLTAIVVDTAGNTLEGDGMLYVRDL